MVALAYNVKCDAHMAMIGQEEYLVPHDRLDDRDFICARIDRLMGDLPGVRERLRAKAGEFREMNLRFARRFLSLIDG